MNTNTTSGMHTAGANHYTSTPTNPNVNATMTYIDANTSACSTAHACTTTTASASSTSEPTTDTDRCFMPTLSDAHTETSATAFAWAASDG
uniref:Uncharacterized protein n=1 Tax=Arundo donax TaxID=35708 RepID=A0A0A9EAF4_ARUDO